jgi:hypothetical protein
MSPPTAMETWPATIGRRSLPGEGLKRRACSPLTFHQRWLAQRRLRDGRRWWGGWAVRPYSNCGRPTVLQGKAGAQETSMVAWGLVDGAEKGLARLGSALASGGCHGGDDDVTGVRWSEKHRRAPWLEFYAANSVCLTKTRWLRA